MQNVEQTVLTYVHFLTVGESSPDAKGLPTGTSLSIFSTRLGGYTAVHPHFSLGQTHLQVLSGGNVHCISSVCE